MSHEPQLPPGEAPRWLDHPENRTEVFWSVVAAYVATIVAGFFVHWHPHFSFEQVPGFFAIFGLLCSIGLVLGAAWLRTWIMRDEDYYEREEEL